MEKNAAESESSLTDSEKVRLECENLRLEIDRLVTRDRLEREQLERTVRELKRAPMRNLILGLLTILATTATSVGVGFLAFTVNQTGSEQHEREVYQQLVAGLEQRNASVRLGAVTALGDYVAHPSCGRFARCRDRSDQTFAMLTGRLIAETDPFVLGALVQTLAKSDVDSGAAIGEMEAVNNQVQSNFLHSIQVSFAPRSSSKQRAPVINRMNDEILDAITLLAVPDKQGADAFDALYALEDTLLTDRRQDRFTSSIARHKGTAVEIVRVTALQAAAASLAMAGFIAHVPRYLTDNYLSDTLVAGATLDKLDLTGIQADGATILGTARRTILSCANFQGADVEGLDMERAMVNGTDFAEALLPDNGRFRVGTLAMPDLDGSNWYLSATAKTEGTYFHKKLLKREQDGTIAADRAAFESARSSCRSQHRVASHAAD